jgi:uncharacterized protein YndB with AHSA1/START domain
MVFREIVPIERLVYGWDAQGTGIAAGEVTLTLTEGDGKTQLVQHFVGEISEEMFPFMEQGTSEQLDKLVALVED